jgi:HK97 family phage prohead protease
MVAVTEAPSLHDAAQRRAEAAGKLSTGDARRSVPNDVRARAVPFAAKLSAKLVERDGRSFHQTDGYASITDRSYEMWDFFGPYEEVMAQGAFDETLGAKPDVAFLLNHRGMTMARTTNGTLDLSADALGLKSTAFLNPERTDVKDLVSAISDELITEMSFAFMIERSTWNDDYTKFTIEQVDLDRGDVSAVNYGANPYTSIAARSREVMQDLMRLPEGAQRVALARLQASFTTTASVEQQIARGRSLSHIEALLDDGLN